MVTGCAVDPSAFGIGAADEATERPSAARSEIIDRGGLARLVGGCKERRRSLSAGGVRRGGPLGLGSGLRGGLNHGERGRGGAASCGGAVRQEKPQDH